MKYAMKSMAFKQVGDVFVFASVDIAVHLHAIYAALNESRTWGEFRQLLPAGEWPDGLPGAEAGASRPPRQAGCPAGSA